MKFKNDWLRELVYEDHDEAEIIKDEICDNSRWSIIHDLIFKIGEKYYRTSYSVGATECQDERPFEYGEETECIEVVPVTKTIIVYKPIDKVVDEKYGLK